MDRTVVRPEAPDHMQSNLSRSFNDLYRGQELRPLKPLSTAQCDNAKEELASFPSIALPKISSERQGKPDDLNSVAVLMNSGLSLLETNKKSKNASRNLQRMETPPTRPKSCTARVLSTTSPQRTPELLRRSRMPRPSLPLSEELKKLHCAPSSPTQIRKPQHVSYSKALSFTSSQPIVKETDLVDFRQKSHDIGPGSSSTPPMSPSLLRKLEDSDKTVRKAKNLIDDYKRSSPVLINRQRAEAKSLAEAMEEVKNCRYLRVIKRKDQVT